MVDSSNDHQDIWGEFFQTHYCMVGAIGDAVGESDLKPLYEHYERETETLLKIDLMKCGQSGEDEVHKYVYEFNSLKF